MAHARDRGATDARGAAAHRDTAPSRAGPACRCRAHVRGLYELARGEPAAAAISLRTAAAQAAAGDDESAFATWRRACAELPDSALAWFNLASPLNAHAEIAAVTEPMQRCVALAPDNSVARVMLGDMLAQLGRIDDAAAQYREVSRTRPDTGHAWWELANLKTHRFDAAVSRDARIRPRQRARAKWGLRDRLGDIAGCECAHASHDAVEHGGLPRRDRARAQRVRAAACGRELIFTVTLPRAGSTLVEQILAAHSEVEGAGELADIEAVIRAESGRWRMDFPAWVTHAARTDWQRLGETYLARSACWRAHKPRSIDKLPGNWVFIGAIRAMLPAARMIDCRRDPVETAWSCFKQVFGAGNAFSYGLTDIADYWKVYDETMRFWTRLHANHLRAQHLEALIAQPEAQIRELLVFLGLLFEAACVDFQRVDRAVRTPSVACVREPLRRAIPRADLYGERLDALRNALHRPG